MSFPNHLCLTTQNLTARPPSPYNREVTHLVKTPKLSKAKKYLSAHVLVRVPDDALFRPRVEHDVPAALASSSSSSSVRREGKVYQEGGGERGGIVASSCP